MDNRTVEAELRALAARLDRLEKYLGVSSPQPPAQPEPPAEPHPPTQPPTPEPAPPTEPPAAHPPASAPPPEPESRPAIVMERTEHLFAATRDSSNRPAQKAKAASLSLEMLIGERWMAWAGAIVIVLAVGFFIKLAYDLGWWGRLSPLAKCMLTAGFGTILLAAGEVAFRRIGRWAAVSLFGAGLGTLYLTAFATFRFFDLLSESSAFWLMLLVTALGLAITLRAQLVVIGVLSLLGGYLSPILLADQVTFAAALPLYVTSLLVVALTLSATRPTPFRTLRYVGLLLHAIVAGLWILNEGVDHWLLAMSFMTGWWALTTAEALWAALRGQSTRSNPIVSLLFTLWYVSIGCNVLATAEPLERGGLGIFAGAVAAICGWAALAFGPGLAVLRIRPRRAIELFNATLWAQAGILVATAIGLQFRDPNESFGQTIGWIVMGLACIEIGRRLPSRPVDCFGLLLSIAAIGRLWIADVWISRLQTVLWAYGDISIDYWTILAVGVVLATLLIARRLRLPDSRAGRWAGGFITLVGTLQWLAVCVHACDEAALTTAWLLIVATLIILAPTGQSPGYRGIAMLALALTAAKWILIDAGFNRLASAWTPDGATPFANWPMAVAVLISGCFYCLHATRRCTSPPADEQALLASLSGTPADANPVGGVLLVDGMLFLLIALSFQVEHVIAVFEHALPRGETFAWPPTQLRLFWWIALWTVGGVTMLPVGRAGRSSVVISAGWFLIIAATVAWLIFGTLAWRIDSGVGAAPAILNLQFLVGLGLGIVLAIAATFARRTVEAVPELARSLASATPTSVALLVAIGLWLGSLEIDRFIAHRADRLDNAAMILQTALSIYWGIYAIGLVALGFWRRTAPLRYTGLALLAITLGKVLIVDLSNVQYVYRVLSLLATGLLFIITSIAYARLASRLADQSSQRDQA